MKERAHSKYSASGADRRHNCAASVELEEKAAPSKDTVWSIEGTAAHAQLERRLKGLPYEAVHVVEGSDGQKHPIAVSWEMRTHIDKVVLKVKAIHEVAGGLLLVERKVFNNSIHPEMFGTCDVIIVGKDDYVYIIDFKYGQGHVVDVVDNLQLLQYVLAVCEAYNFKFWRAKVFILQPRAGANWHKSCIYTMEELKHKWVPAFKNAVTASQDPDAKPTPGAWCHWCRAKAGCPALNEKRAAKVLNIFNDETKTTEGNTNGKRQNEETNGQSQGGFGFAEEGQKAVDAKGGKKARKKAAPAKTNEDGYF